MPCVQIAALVARCPGYPVARASGVVTRSADQARPGHQQPVASNVTRCLLAGDLCLAILIDAGLVAIGGREYCCALVGARGCL